MYVETGSPVHATKYTYDRARRLTKVEFDTDGDGQVEQSVSYAYDGSGPRTKLVLPDGKTIAYEYDVNGRLVRAVDWDGQSARYAWDLAGRLVGVERSNAFESYYNNDAAGRLRSLKHVYRGAVVAQFDYAVDARGNRTQAVETILQPDDSTDVHTIGYAYDALSRLLQAQYADGGGVFRQYDYEYDLAGNRTKRVETVSGNPTTTNFTYNAANQLVNDGTNTLTYDDNGNLTNDGTNTYTWDRANRLLSVGGSSYAYDGIGQTVSSIVTGYLLDVQPGLAVVLAASTPGETTRFVHGPRGLERQQGDSGAWLFPVQDGLGSVRGMLDNDWPDSDVLGTRQYAPYGVPFDAEGSVDTPFGFTGEQVDGNDLVYLRARYLNPELGIFASVDPFEGMLQVPMSLNPYSWVHNNPANRVDPSGLQSDDMEICYSQCTYDPCRWAPDFRGICVGSCGGHIMQSGGCEITSGRDYQISLCLAECMRRQQAHVSFSLGPLLDILLSPSGKLITDLTADLVPDLATGAAWWWEYHFVRSSWSQYAREHPVETLGLAVSALTGAGALASAVRLLSILGGGSAGFMREWTRQLQQNLDRGQDFLQATYHENLDVGRLTESTLLSATMGLWKSAGVFSSGWEALHIANIAKTPGATFWGSMISLTADAVVSAVVNMLEGEPNIFEGVRPGSSMFFGGSTAALSALWAKFVNTTFPVASKGWLKKGLTWAVNVSAQAAGYSSIGGTTGIAQMLVSELEGDGVSIAHGGGMASNVLSVISDPRIYIVTSFLSSIYANILIKAEEIGDAY